MILEGVPLAGQTHWSSLDAGENRMIRHRFAVVLLLSLSAVAPMSRLSPAEPRETQSSQHQHTPPITARSTNADETSHHSCLEQERAALKRGEGYGMALAADRNGYPGPKHVLDWKAELKLTREQQAAMETLFARMKEQALARGNEVLLAEARLEKMFAENRPEAELREETYRVVSLRAELRWVHLSAHLAARKLLMPEQLAAYARLRHTPR